jgi:hypothetical protein
MNALYTLNTDELDEVFLQTLKTLFPHKMVKLAVHEVSNATQATEPNLKQLFASVTEGLTDDDLARPRDFGKEATEWNT